MVKRILVTGGAGFIGSHVVDELVSKGVEVRVIDSLHPAAHDGRPDYLNPAADYLFADVRDPAALHRVLHGVDAVAHLAAMVGLGVDFDDSVDYTSNNDVGTATLLRALYGSGFSGRFVLASSMVVYGEGRYRCVDHGIVPAPPRNPEALREGRFEVECPSCGREMHPKAVPEDAPLDPRNVYAATKLHQEHLAVAWARESSGSLSVMRYHNVYGSRMPIGTPYAGVASLFRSALQRGESPRVFEDGHQIRDFVHVQDVARATCMPLLSTDPIEGAFNVASGEPHTIGDVASAMADAYGTSSAKPATTGEFRLGDVRHVFASAKKAEGGLGFRAAVDFKTGMADFAVSPMRIGRSSSRAV